MLEKHRATLTNGRVEWNGEVPSDINPTGPTTVDIIVVSPKPKLKKPNGKRMADALRGLKSIEERGGIKSISDPIKWQRSMRKDRSIPGR